MPTLTVKAISANNRKVAPDLEASGLSVKAAPIPKMGYKTNSATKAAAAMQTTKKACFLVIAVTLVQAETTAYSLSELRISRVGGTTLDRALLVTGDSAGAREIIGDVGNTAYKSTVIARAVISTLHNQIGDCAAS